MGLGAYTTESERTVHDIDLNVRSPKSAKDMVFVSVPLVDGAGQRRDLVGVLQLRRRSPDAWPMAPELCFVLQRQGAKALRYFEPFKPHNRTARVGALRLWHQWAFGGVFTCGVNQPSPAKIRAIYGNRKTRPTVPTA